MHGTSASHALHRQGRVVPGSKFGDSRRGRPLRRRVVAGCYAPLARIRDLMSRLHCCRPYTASIKRIQELQYGFGHHTCEDAGRCVVAVAHVPLVAVPDVVDLQRAAYSSSLHGCSCQLLQNTRAEGMQWRPTGRRSMLLQEYPGSKPKCDPPLTSCPPNLELWLVLECMQGQGAWAAQVKETASRTTCGSASRVAPPNQVIPAEPWVAPVLPEGCDPGVPYGYRAPVRPAPLQNQRSGRHKYKNSNMLRSPKTERSPREGGLLKKPFSPHEARTKCQVLSLHSHSPCAEYPSPKKTCMLVCPCPKDSY